MFGVNCFVVQVLHRRRKRGGGVSAYVLVSIVLLFRCFHRRRKVGGGEAHPII